MDFAVSLLPGWRTTVSTLLRRRRDLLGFRHGADADADLPLGVRTRRLVTLRHFDYMARIMLVTGTIVGSPMPRVLHCVVRRNPYELYASLNRALGPSRRPTGSWSAAT